jgi:hypothetical protein
LNIFDSHSGQRIETQINQNHKTIKKSTKKMQTKNIITSAICLAILIGGTNTAAVNAIEQTSATAAIDTNASLNAPSIEDLQKIIAELKVQIQATIEKIQEIAKTRNTTSSASGSTTGCIAENQISTDTNRNCCGGLLKAHVSTTSLPEGCGSTSDPCNSTTENYTCKRTTLGYSASPGTNTVGTGTHYSSGGSAGTTVGTGVGHSFGGSIGNATTTITGVGHSYGGSAGTAIGTGVGHSFNTASSATSGATGTAYSSGISSATGAGSNSTATIQQQIQLIQQQINNISKEISSR